MRLDKYLKVSRLIKRRTLAKDAADRGRIFVNSRLAKAATELAVGDTLQLQLGARQLTVEVLALTENVRAAEASGMYRIIKDERPVAKD